MKINKSFWLAPLALIALTGLVGLVAKVTVAPVKQEALTELRVFAYKDWQSVGVQLHTGDVVHIRAAGSWMYTPGEYHGPEGHHRYSAPSFYPLPNVRGGALIGRIGADGRIFYVGQGGGWQVDREGVLYLRIDDDVLSDNDGWVTVEVTVSSTEAELH